MLFPPLVFDDIVATKDLSKEINRLKLKGQDLENWLKNNFRKLNYFELNIAGVDQKITSKDLPALKNTKTIFCINREISKNLEGASGNKTTINFDYIFIESLLSDPITLIRFLHEVGHLDYIAPLEGNELYKNCHFTSIWSPPNEEKFVYLFDFEKKATEFMYKILSPFMTENFITLEEAQAYTNQCFRHYQNMYQEAWKKLQQKKIMNVIKN